MIKSAVVPSTLLDQLHSLDARFEAREAMIQAERAQLEAERERFQLAVAAKEWEMQQEQHKLTVQQEAWEASLSEATHVGGYQDQRMVVVADGGQVSTAVATLCGREPASGLAAAARALSAKAAADSEEEDAMGAMYDAVEGGSAPLYLYVDREAALTHRVVDWLRDGPSALDGLPVAILRPLVLEGEHWKMPSLVAQATERLGKADAASEGVANLEWTLGELQQHPQRMALCRAALEELRRWLASSRERRRVAIRRGREVPAAALLAMERHAADPPLMVAGLSVCVLLGAEPEGRTVARALRPRLNAVIAAGRQLAVLTREGAEAHAALAEAAEAAEVAAAESEAVARAAAEAEAAARADTDAGAEAALDAEVDAASVDAAAVEAAVEAETDTAAADGGAASSPSAGEPAEPTAEAPSEEAREADLAAVAAAVEPSEASAAAGQPTAEQAEPRASAEAEAPAAEAMSETEAEAPAAEADVPAAVAPVPAPDAVEAPSLLQPRPLWAAASATEERQALAARLEAEAKRLERMVGLL